LEFFFDGSVAGFDAVEVDGLAATAFFVLKDENGSAAAEDFDKAEPVTKAGVLDGFVVFAGVV